jgi:hypothetical protein
VIPAFLFLAVAGSSASDVRFASEVVRMEIEPRRVIVRGQYDFVTDGHESYVSILYPFASDSLMTDANVLRMTPEPLARDASGVHVRVPLDQAGHGRLEIDYEQRLLGRRAVYLLRTTKQWGRPLDRATFEVDWPDSLGEPRFDFPLRAVSHGKARTRYRFEARSFFPEQDLRVEW